MSGGSRGFLSKMQKDMKMFFWLFIVVFFAFIIAILILSNYDVSIGIPTIILLAVFILCFVGKRVPEIHVLEEEVNASILREDVKMSFAFFVALFSMLIFICFCARFKLSLLPPYELTCISAAFISAFTISFMLGYKTKSLWYLLAAFIISGMVGVILGFTATYPSLSTRSYSLEDIPTGFLAFLFILLVAFLSALIGIAGEAMGVIIAHTRLKKPSNMHCTHTTYKRFRY